MAVELEKQVQTRHLPSDAKNFSSWYSGQLKENTMGQLCTSFDIFLQSYVNWKVTLSFRLLSNHRMIDSVHDQTSLYIVNGLHGSSVVKTDKNFRVGDTCWTGAEMVTSWRPLTRHLNAWKQDGRCCWDTCWRARKVRCNEAHRTSAYERKAESLSPTLIQMIDKVALFQRQRAGAEPFCCRRPEWPAWSDLKVRPAINV